jgi:hypothetical protein
MAASLAVDAPLFVLEPDDAAKPPFTVLLFAPVSRDSGRELVMVNVPERTVR